MNTGGSKRPPHAPADGADMVQAMNDAVTLDALLGGAAALLGTEEFRHACAVFGVARASEHRSRVRAALAYLAAKRSAL